MLSIIIVTHNSQRHIHKNIACLDQQSMAPDRVVIVDSGSEDTSYLDTYRQRPHFRVIADEKDIGFCRGNNVGMQHIMPDSTYVLFLNPDAFLTPGFIEEATALMEAPQHSQVACLTGPLLRYDIEADTPTGHYDSSGVFRTWYGRWYDRGQAEPISTLYNTEEHLPAICGALMFCRKTALDSILIRGNEVWDSSFYMYKDDIDLSLRLRDKGWKLLYTPNLIAYHCRGWKRNRRAMPRQYRLMSARNELRIHARQKSLCTSYSLVKYLAVKVLNW